MKNKKRNRNKHIDLTLKAYNENAVSGDFFPVYYGIEVTRQCNFRCIMCPNQQFAKNQKGHMDIDLFNKIIHKIAPYAEIVKLHWIGEPLLHPQIIDLIKIARSNINTKLNLVTTIFVKKTHSSQKNLVELMQQIVLYLQRLMKSLEQLHQEFLFVLQKIILVRLLVESFL